MSETTVGLDPSNQPPSAWGVSLDGPNQDHMRKRLAAIEPGARAKIFHTAAKILGQCPPPTAKSGRVTGLALGKVQSGKTSSFITLAAQAFDNGYGVVIILAGTKTNLLRQNTQRIDGELAEGRRMDVIVTTTERGANPLRPEDVVQLVKLGRPVVITILKHAKHIKQVAQMFHHPDMANVPVLIIDDEGDQASLNSRKPPKRGAINAAIKELRDTVKHHSFIAYTATPQANLLIDTLDELSPEFCVLIEPGPGYTGGSTFHGTNQDLYVRSVPQEDNPDPDAGTQDSLEYALATFFVGAVVRRLRNDHGYHSMLVHTSHRRTDHEEVHAQVEALVNGWRSCLALPNGDAAKQVLLVRMKQGYDDLATTVQALPTWQQIVEHLPSTVEDCKPWIVNSSDQGEIPDPKNMPFHNNIFIGGNMLDRGVTIPGLAVTFITRWAKENQADTVEQRARWFGYKQAYLDVCRIWAPRPVLDGFAALLGHEDTLWRDLRQWEQTNRSVKEWQRLLRLDDPSMKPTRSAVASFSEVDLRDTMAQLRPAVAPAQAAANLAVVRDFFQGVGAEAREFTPQTHMVATGVSRERIQSDLLNRLQQVDPRWSGPALEQLLNQLADVVPLDELDVLWIENEMNGIRHRTLQDDGSIPGLLQGYQKKYKGDRNLLEGRPHVQVHTPMLRDRDRKDLRQAVILAVIIPGAEKAAENAKMRLVRSKHG